jgi:hypothetical protein
VAARNRRRLNGMPVDFEVRLTRAVFMAASMGQKVRRFKTEERGRARDHDA